MNTKPLQLRIRPLATLDCQVRTMQLVRAVCADNVGVLIASQSSMIDPLTLFERVQDDLMRFRAILAPNPLRMGEFLAPMVVLLLKFPAIFATHQELSRWAEILLEDGLNLLGMDLARVVREHVQACSTEMEIALGDSSLIGWNETSNILMRRMGLTGHLLALYNEAVSEPVPAAHA